MNGMKELIDVLYRDRNIRELKEMIKVYVQNKNNAILCLNKI